MIPKKRTYYSQMHCPLLSCAHTWIRSLAHVHLYMDTYLHKYQPAQILNHSWRLVVEWSWITASTTVTPISHVWGIAVVDPVKGAVLFCWITVLPD